MNDIQKRAHDIACAILPKFMEQDKVKILVPDGPNSEKLEFSQLVDVYSDLYEGILTALEYTGDYV